MLYNCCVKAEQDNKEVKEKEGEEKENEEQPETNTILEI